MPLNQSVRIANDRSKSALRNLSMFCLRVVFPSLVAILFLFPHAAKAGSIDFQGTGFCFCIITLPNIYYPDFIDPAYTSLAGPGLNGAGPLVSQAGTFPYLGPPAGISYIPSTGGWDFPGGDSAVCTTCGVFDWYTEIFIAPETLPGCDTYSEAFGNPSCAITITGSLSAEGYVAAAVGPEPGAGYGGYLKNSQGVPILFSTAAATPFAISFYAFDGGNYLDFIFTGCNSYDAVAGDCNPPANNAEPITALYVDPSWTPAALGTPVADISESVLIADGGVAPTSSAPEPSSLMLLGSAVLAMGGMGILRRRHKLA